ncbi:hypothetical protein [Microbacterium sp. A1-JK]|uniref:hypothetical protein n=1 Tax=Microbacterium sp. A1-JK TaxID=3177516 RepID=UPI0038838A60
MGVRAQVSMTSNVDRTTEQINTGLVTGENLAAEYLLALSAPLAPLDLGTLVGSGTVERATTPDEGSAVVYDTPYAATHHEHPERNFQNGRQGKYVETPAVQNKGPIGDIIRKQVRGG